MNSANHCLRVGFCYYLLFGNWAAYTTVVRLILHTKRTEKVYPYFTFLHVG